MTRPGATPHEAFRATLQARTPDREIATVIVTRQAGQDRPVWLSFSATYRSTITLTREQADHLADLLRQARSTATNT